MTQPYKYILAIDFETRWSSKPTPWSPDEAYTLSKLTTEEYIRDPRFKAFGACIHELGASTPVQWYSHDELPRILSMYDWNKTAVLAHNAQFDVGILSFIYGVKPCFIFDSLSMARALRGVEVGNSLAKLAAAFNLPPKGQAVHSTDGLEDITPEIERELAAYCAHDVYLCEQIFSKLLLGVTPEEEIGSPYPKSELRLISMTLKMFTEPMLVLDAPMLEKAKAEDAEKLKVALEKAGVEESDLASNEKFAELLEQHGIPRPMKTSKTTGKPALALAKTDALFQAMLNGDNENVALLCEARLKVKSTGERTRAQRFIGIAARGALPVPLNYYGAGTGRYTATGKINMQNLKRGSYLRRAVCAPEGHQVIAGDLSQIEPRVLAWFADYDDLLDIFRAGGDPYATFGSQMFGIPGMTKESHPLLRQSAKSGMLGCFGATTLVLTQRGWVPIVDVRVTDTTWDGIEWTRHSGVVAQGEKEVLSGYGIQATSDHEILTGRGWRAWSAVLQDPSLFKSALASGSLPAWVGSADQQDPSGRTSTYGNHACVAHADGRVLSIAETFAEGEPHAAALVPKKKHWPRDWSERGMNASAQIARTVTGSWIASALSLLGAQIQKARRTLTMVAGASRCILRGWRTAPSFWPTLSNSTVGTTTSCSSTGRTTSADTYQATCASSHAASTWPTNAGSLRGRSSNCVAGSLPSKQRTQTYDIAMAGPRNRYTILTDAGPIVVHNCGYQLGWSSFAGQLLVGFLGAPPQRYTMADAKQLGVTKQHVLEFLDNEDNMERMAEIPHTCTQDELLVHCLAAKAIIEKYRTAAAPIVQSWDLLGRLITHSLIGGNVYQHKCLTFKKGEIVLANGMSLLYPDIQIQQTKRGVQYHYAAGDKRVKLYPGKVCNNVTQGTARIVMTDGMLRVDKRFPVKGSVHDELLAIAPDSEVEEGKVWVKQQMIREPKYLPGIPLNADVGASRRYGDAKK